MPIDQAQALLCTDLAAEPARILGWFVLRWQMEATFQEVRRHVMVEIVVGLFYEYSSSPPGEADEVGVGWAQGGDRGRKRGHRRCPTKARRSEGDSAVRPSPLAPLVCFC